MKRTTIGTALIAVIAAILLAAFPVYAGPLTFDATQVSDTVVNFNVEHPPEPGLVGQPPDPVIPVEILSMMLMGATQGAVGVSMAIVGSDNGVGGDPGDMGMVDFNVASGNPPDDNQPISFDVFFDVAPLGRSNPMMYPPDPGTPAPTMFDVFFDVDTDGGIAHHMLHFEAPGLFTFDNVSVVNGNSFHLLFELVPGTDTGGTYPEGETLLSMTATGTFTVPEPTTLGIFALGLAGMGFIRRRKAYSA